MNESIETMILNAFNTKVNFESEFLEPAVRNDVSLDIFKKILDPLFPVKVNSEFNPHRIFAKQSLRRQSPAKEEALWQLEEDRMRQQEKQDRERQQAKQQRIREYLLLLLHPLLDTEEIRLSEIINNLQEEAPDKYGTINQSVAFLSLYYEITSAGHNSAGNPG